MPSNRTGARVLVLGTLAALVLGACGASATPAPSTAVTPTKTAAPATQAPASAAAATDQPATGGSDPIAALQNLNSYKIAMDIESKNVTGALASFGGIKMSGTVIVKPQPAADITMEMGASGSAMKIRVVEVNGKSYVDLGTGSLVESTGSQTSLVDSFKPEKLFGSMGSSVSQMQVVGDETKNGVATTHVKASADQMGPAGSALGGAFGLPDGQWSMEAWIAKDGGYAVSWIVTGSGTVSGQAASLSMSLDLTDVNSSANKVDAP